MREIDIDALPDAPGIDKHDLDLHQAVDELSDSDFAEILVGRVDVEERTRDGLITALMRAAQSCGAGKVKALLAAGADPTLTTDDGETPLHWAATSMRSAPEVREVMKALVEAGGKLEAKDANGNTPLASACQLGRLHCARALVECGASLDARNEDGWLPEELAKQGSLLQQAMIAARMERDMRLAASAPARTQSPSPGL